MTLRLLAPLCLALGAVATLSAQPIFEARAQSSNAAALNYMLDASASEVTARVPFFGLSSKTARFPSMAGAVTIVPGAPEDAVIDVTFDARELEAPDETTLRRLRGERFFWVERYPTIRFVGESLSMSSPTEGTLTGELTARGVTQSETLEITFANDPTSADGQAVDFSGEMVIDRREYGMRSYQLIVGNKVRIRLNARMVPDEVAS
ncbi:MAG: YceI family protein [Pseudomonadota bacterium]